MKQAHSTDAACAMSIMLRLVRTLMPNAKNDANCQIPNIATTSRGACTTVERLAAEADDGSVGRGSRIERIDGKTSVLLLTFISLQAGWDCGWDEIGAGLWFEGLVGLGC